MSGFRDIRIAHVVRNFGGLTEPFIEQRVAAAAGEGQLWFERAQKPAPIPSRRIRVPVFTAGGTGDRVFHRLPLLGRLLAPAYAAAEKDYRPTVVHAHYLTTGFLMAIATSAPLVVSTYGFDVSVIPRRRLWASPIRTLAERAAAILVEGPAMRDRVIALGFPSPRVQVVPIAAGLDRLEYRDPPVPGSAVRLLLVGRMVEKKGHAIALRALAALLSQGTRQYSLRIVGDGPLFRTLARLAKELGAGSAVTFLGALSRDRYLDELRAANVLLVPSVTARNGDTEGGAPTAILDAHASGIVVIGSTHADIPFLVEDRKTGFLFPEGDAEELARTIEAAVGARETWGVMSLAARHQVETRHSDAAVSRLLEQIHAGAGS